MHGEKSNIGPDFIVDNKGREVLVRNIQIAENTFASEYVMTKDEFLAAYNRWIKGETE